MGEKRLSDLKKGESGRILGIQNAELRLKLIRLGVAPGDIVMLTNIAPFSGPVAILINGTKISLRRHDAGVIRIESL